MINENKINFKTLEKEIFRKSCEAGLNLMKEQLENIDNTLRDARDKKQLRCKGKRKLTIITIMGDLEINRQVYQYKDEEGNNCTKYLLDEYLEFDTIGKISQNLAEIVVSNATETSFRESANTIKLTTNQNISHSTVHKVVQNLGNKIIQQEERNLIQSKQGSFKDTLEPKVLFQEQDGVWVKLQGKDRSKSKKSFEVKIGMAHTGWEKRHPSSNEYLIQNKILYSTTSGAKDFADLSYSTLAKHFNLDEVEYTLINGDGAKWIKDYSGIEKSHSQIDPFHIAQAITRGIRDKKLSTKLKHEINKGEIDIVLEQLVALLIENNQNEKEFKKLSDLYNYLSLNRNRLIPIHLRNTIKLPTAPIGVEYRTLGNMEHNIDLVSRRLKRKGRTWSIEGANRMTKLITAKVSKNLSQILCNTSTAIADTTIEALKDIDCTTKLRNQMPRFKKEYIVQKGQIPFENSSLSPGRKVIKNICKLKPMTDLVYR